MASARERALRAIKVGDVIFGIAGGGQTKVMLVYRSDENRIFARHVTSQARVEFGRDGQSRRVPGGGSCTIVSTAPLPPETYAVAVGLDRKMQPGRADTDYKLSDAETQLILKGDAFFLARPLPE